MNQIYTSILPILQHLRWPRRQQQIHIKPAFWNRVYIQRFLICVLNNILPKNSEASSLGLNAKSCKSFKNKFWDHFWVLVQDRLEFLSAISLKSTTNNELMQFILNLLFSQYLTACHKSLTPIASWERSCKYLVGFEQVLSIAIFIANSSNEEKAIANLWFWAWLAFLSCWDQAGKILISCPKQKYSFCQSYFISTYFKCFISLFIANTFKSFFLILPALQ